MLSEYSLGESNGLPDMLSDIMWMVPLS